MNHFEREFEKLFGELCPAYKMKYFKIHDPLPIDKYGNVIKSGEIHISKKRDFDGVLITVNGNYILEFKWGNGKLKPHQEKAERDINAINNSYYIVRKKVLKKGLVYSVEQGKSVFTTDSMEKLFMFFNDPDEFYAEEFARKQRLVFDSILPHTKRKPRMNRTTY